MSAISFGIPNVLGYGKIVGYHWNSSTLSYEVNTGGTSSGPDVNVTNFPATLATTTLQTDIKTELQVLNSLVPSKYDYISLGYTGSNLTTVIFKNGGSGGTTVATLTLAYTGSQLDSVTKT